MSMGDKELDKGQIDSPVAPLRQAAQELNRNFFNPEAVTNFQQAFWQVPRGGEGFTFDIPPLSATSEQLKKPFIDIEGRELLPLTIYIPEELRGKEGLIKLGKMFPELGSYSVKEGTPIEDVYHRTGYIRVEGVIDSPNPNTNEDQLRKHFNSQGVLGQRLITYIIASRQMKIIKGQYPDQGTTWSRLLGSRGDGRAVCAHCLPGGRVHVDRGLGPRDRGASLGARSEEVL